MRSLLRLLVATLLAVSFVASLQASASAQDRTPDRTGATATSDGAQQEKARCRRNDLLGTFDQICTGWGRKYQGAGVYQPTSYWNRDTRSKKTNRLIFNLKLSDLRADGKCAWVRATKDGSYAYSQYIDSACGKGTSKVLNFELVDLPDVAPGKFRLQVCGGQGNCRTIFTRRFIA